MASGNSRFQFLKNTSTNWSSADTTLREGELGFETNFNRFKIGNNGLSWNKLNYASDLGIVGAAEVEYPKADTKMTTFISIKDPGYGAIGDGTLHFLNERYDTVSAARAVYGGTFITDVATQTIDWAAIQKALNNTNVQVLVPSGTYVLGINGTLRVSVTNVNLYGVGTSSLITSSLTQNILFLATCSNVSFTDIGFSTTITTSASEPVVKTNETTITDVTFKRCFFSAPNSPANGFAGNNTNLTNITNNIRFLECRFENCGRMGIEFVNHREPPHLIVYRCRGIVVDKCTFKNIGSFVNGMGVSLSGYGMNCIITNNTFDNVQLCIEIIGFSNTTIAYNKFRNFPIPNGGSIQTSAPLRMTGVEGRLMYNNVIIGNICEDAANTSTMIWLQRNSVCANNYWKHNASPNFEFSRFDTRNNQNIWFYNDIYETGDDAVFYLQDESSLGTAYKLNFDTSSSFIILGVPVTPPGVDGPYSTNGLSVGDTIEIRAGLNTGTYIISAIDTATKKVTVSSSTFVLNADTNVTLRVNYKMSGVYLNNCTFDNSSNTRSSGTVFQSNGAISDNMNIVNCIFKTGNTARPYYPTALIANSKLNVFLSKDVNGKLFKNSTVIPIGNSYKTTLIKNITGNSVTLNVNAGTTATLNPLIITLRISSCSTNGVRFGFAERSYYFTQSSGITYRTENDIISASAIAISYNITGSSILFTIQNTSVGGGTIIYNFNINVSINSINIPIVT
jgi:hypothetical protein